MTLRLETLLCLNEDLGLLIKRRGKGLDHGIADLLFEVTLQHQVDRIKVF